MRNIWEKIKGFFSRIWNGLTKAGRIILGALILIVIVLIGFAVAKDTDEERHENNPEVARVREPSIGEALPPDVPGENGSVGGAETTTPSSELVAPAAGVDDHLPIKYENNDLKFAATLPAYSDVKEETDRIIFTSAQGSLYYIVSVNDASNETLADIEAQLRNSPTAGNISRTKIGSAEALQFNAKGYGTGIAFIANGKIYYLLGDKQNFSDFKLL